MLFALGEHGELPAFFARVHPRYRTPANAIVFTSAVALALGLSGSFAHLAVVSALARLVAYAGACASALRLRAMENTTAAPPFDRATYVTPFGPLVPVIGLAVCAGVVAGATRAQLSGGFGALVAGAMLFGVNARASRNARAASTAGSLAR